MVDFSSIGSRVATQVVNNGLQKVAGNVKGLLSGGIKKFIIEVKPEYQCKQPTKTPKKRTRKWYNEVKTWGINNAKWKSAIDWCENRGMEFKILTEKHLNPQYK